MYHQINEIKLRPISQAILKHLMDNPIPASAETIWLEVKANGGDFSIASVYGHLNRLVTAGIINKIAKDRKSVYMYKSS